MSRKPRIYSSTNIYHVILRSINQQILMEEEADYLKFYYMLLDCKEIYKIEIYAYCIMDNHIHILLKDPECSISQCFRWMVSRFAKWYNQEHGRTGHLFQGRFHSKPIERMDYFITAMFYIHNNPVKQNICRFAQDYRWSSCSAYYGKANPLVSTSFADETAGSREKLLALLQEQERKSKEKEYEKNLYQMYHMSDEDVLDLMHKLTGYRSPSEIQQLNRTERNTVVRALAERQVSYSQIARICGISKTTVYRIVKQYIAHKPLLKDGQSC